jgi:hypothetical protein
MSFGIDQTPAQRKWFIQVEGQAYGPFDDKTLWDYMVEGRVSAQSLVSQTAGSGYRPISADPGLMNWIAQATERSQAAVQSQDQAEAKPQLPPTVFMIMAEIKSGGGMNFLQTLQTLGPTQRLGSTVWVLQAQAQAETLRDILSQPLGADDRLFVLDSFANKTAWFNLSPEMDAQIAQLWNIER